MFLQDILDNAQWTEQGIVCSNADSAWCVYKFIREAILDRHIYHSKVIGFCIQGTTVERSHVHRTISRNKQIGESYPEIVVNLLDKVFLDTSSSHLLNTLQAGNNVMGTQKWGANRDSETDVLYVNPNICRCLRDSCTLKVQIAYDCGYRSMAQNSNSLGKQFFPCYTDYSLQEYVRVIPMTYGSNVVKINYYNNMTVDKFKGILSKWSEHCKSKDIKKEELVWLQSFEL